MEGMTDLEKKEALAAEAGRLLQPGSMFNQIITSLTSECIQELTNAAIGDLTATAAHAKLKALNDIKGRLRSIQNDATMARHRV